MRKVLNSGRRWRMFPLVPVTVDGRTVHVPPRVARAVLRGQIGPA